MNTKREFCDTLIELGRASGNRSNTPNAPCILSGSRRGPGFKSQRSQTLKTGNFEALEVTVMYFTFLETSYLYLFVVGLKRLQLY